MARGYANLKFEWNGRASAVIKNLGFGKELNHDAAEILEAYAQPFMPYKDGGLSTNIRINAFDDHATITHLVKYANKQYELVTPNRNKRIHPLATDHWYEEAYRVSKRQITKEVDEARLKYRSFNY